jgi:hypothetical protein
MPAAHLLAEFFAPCNTPLIQSPGVLNEVRWRSFPRSVMVKNLSVTSVRVALSLGVSWLDMLVEAKSAYCFRCGFTDTSQRFLSPETHWAVFTTSVLEVRCEPLSGTILLISVSMLTLRGYLLRACQEKAQELFDVVVEDR